MRRLILASVLTLGCASMAMPPGGPVRRLPAQVLAHTPDTNATSVTDKVITVQFDEVISEPPRAGGSSGGLAPYVLLSPTSGDLKVDWHRDRITIVPGHGFRPNTSYNVTLLPGITDLRGHQTLTPSSWKFATGPTFAPFHVDGRIFDWVAEQPAPLAIIQVVAHPTPKDTIVYTGVSDSLGLFSVGPLGAGEYEVRGFIDLNSNRRRDSTEKWSGVIPIRVDSAALPLELLAIERDTLPPDISNVEVIDSMSIRVHFNRPLDPFQQLQPALIRIQRADSSELMVSDVVSEVQDNARRTALALAVADSINRARADSVARANPGRPPAPPPSAAQPVPIVPPTPARPPPPKPRSPAPISTIVIRLAANNFIAREEIVRITARGFRSVMGVSKTTSTTAKRPKATLPSTAKRPK